MSTATGTIRTGQGRGFLDHGINEQFWQGRSDLAEDPRSVTLSKQGVNISKFEVRCFQDWLFDSLDALGAALGGGLTERELGWMQRHEWARTAEDVLWRRSKLGLHMTAGEREALAARMG